jgi:hypothetical protein
MLQAMLDERDAGMWIISALQGFLLVSRPFHAAS